MRYVDDVAKWFISFEPRRPIIIIYLTNVPFAIIPVFFHNSASAASSAARNI